MKRVSGRVSRGLCGLSLASVLALQACGGGGGSDSPNGAAKPAGDVTTAAALQDTQGSTTAKVAVATGGAVSLPLSTARVSLPAAGVAATGDVTVTLKAIDAALAPKSVAGGVYATDTGTQAPLLETFGVIDVQATDATGLALKLAPNKLATLRIPVRTRAATAPATIDLYAFDTAQQIWVKEATATLAGDLATGQYYEGTVSHTGTWAAAVALTDTVKVTGCVTDSANKLPTGTVAVYTDGVNYSALDTSTLGADGKFSVRMKRGASALLVVKAVAKEATVVNALTNVVADKDQGACLQLPEPTDQLTFLGLMTSLDKVVTLALAPSATVSLSTVPQLSPAANVCKTGALGQYTLDGAVATAGLPIAATSTHQLNVGFKGCAPQVAGLGALTGVTSEPVFTGESAAQFSYTLPQAGGFQLTATTQLSSLLDFSARLSASGQFLSTIGSDASGANVTAVVTPAAGATLSNLISGRTLSFVSGSVQVSSTGLRYNDLSFKLSGNTYVVKGALNRGALTADSEVTVSRNGTPVGIINYLTIYGTVDPF